MNHPLLEVENLKTGYGDSEILSGISFSMDRGEFLGLVGPNGAGKSTLLRVLAGLLPAWHGSVRLDGRPLSTYRRRLLARRVAVIHQDFSCPYDFTVFDIVAMGRSPYLHRWRPLSEQDYAVIRHAMEMTEVEGLSERLFHELSGGERQRAVIAKAFAQEPSILLLDEPATHLDLHHQVATFDILARLNRTQEASILCITHDLTLAAQYIDRFLLMNEGSLLAEGSPEEVLTKDLLERLFRTPVLVGQAGPANTPYIYPLKNNA